MDYFEREERRRRIIGWIMLAGLVLLIAFGCVRNCRKGIVVGMGETFLYQRSETLYSNETSQAVVTRDGETVHCELTLPWLSRSAVIAPTGNRAEGYPEYQVTLDSGSVVTGGLYVFGFYNPDWPSDPLIIGGDMDEIPDHWAAKYIMEAAFGELKTNGSGWLVFFGALIYFVGMLAWLFPDQMHSFGNIKNIMYQNAELTADGVVMVQVGGIVVMILGALMALRLIPGL